LFLRHRLSSGLDPVGTTWLQEKSKSPASGLFCYEMVQKEKQKITFWCI